jgi:hypothetical protein
MVSSVTPRWAKQGTIKIKVEKISNTANHILLDFMANLLLINWVRIRITNTPLCFSIPPPFDKIV